MICNKCGNNVDDQATFCPYCGDSISAPQQQYSAPQQQYSAPQQQYSAPQQQYAAPQQPYAAPQQQYGMPQQPYGMPQQPAVPTAAIPGKGMGIAGMVLGIVSLALFCIWYLAIPCAIVGAILSGLAMSKAKQAGVKNGMASAGVVCSCIALGIAIIFLIIGAVGACSIYNSYSRYY